MKRPIRLAILLAAVAVVAAACSSGTDSATDTTAATTTTTQATTTTTASPTTTTTVAPAPTLTFEVDGFPTLENGVHYEGWAIIDGAPIPTGKFNVVDGVLVDLNGASIAAFEAPGLDGATTIVITIEPAGDTDTVPSDTHIVAGDVVNRSFELTTSHPAALGTDFSTAAGTVILATPTNGDGNDEMSGIWFVDLPNPSESLVLPVLPAGWKYEGWAVIDGVPVTSGTFVDVAAADDAAPFSGPEGGPPFPGEDYLLNAPDGATFPTDLRGATVVISVDPDPDDSPAPFVLKPLVGQLADDATDHVNLELMNNAVDLPRGSGSIG